MEIKDTNTLLSYIRTATPENALSALVAYGNNREAKGVQEAWKRTTIILRKAFKRREKRIRDSFVEYDPEIGAISIMSFTNYFAAIEDALKTYYQIGSSDVRSCVSDINDFMYQMLGNVKIDRRILFSKTDQ